MLCSEGADTICLDRVLDNEDFLRKRGESVCTHRKGTLQHKWRVKAIKGKLNIKGTLSLSQKASTKAKLVKGAFENKSEKTHTGCGLDGNPQSIFRRIKFEVKKKEHRLCQ